MHLLALRLTRAENEHVHPCIVIASQLMMTTVETFDT